MFPHKDKKDFGKRDNNANNSLRNYSDQTYFQSQTQPPVWVVYLFLLHIVVTTTL